MYDIVTKLQIWKRGDPLVGDNLHRTLVYTIVQVLDILLSSSVMIGAMKSSGIVSTSNSRSPTSLLENVTRLGGGLVSYAYLVSRLVVSVIKGQVKTDASSFKKAAESIKFVVMNIVANLAPWYVDSINNQYMIFANPAIDFNATCNIR